MSTHHGPFKVYVADDEDVGRCVYIDGPGGHDGDFVRMREDDFREMVATYAEGSRETPA
jgi:hypothetical protein